MTYPKLPLLVISQSNVADCSVASAVLPGDGDGVYDTADGTDADKANADAVSLGEERRVGTEERVRRDDAPDVAKADLPCSSDGPPTVAGRDSC